MTPSNSIQANSIQVDVVVAATAMPTRRLSVLRAVAALLWAGLLLVALHSNGSLTPQESVPVFAIALLILYPLIDVTASLVDARTQRHQAPRTAATQVGNAAISTVAAVLIAVAASHGAASILRVLGTWALLTGLIQLTVAIVRRRSGNPGQWPMILSGLISSGAGLAFLKMSTDREVKLTSLAGYAAFGAIFFLVSAWRLRSSQA